MSGISRRIDRLGRIVIPIEVRKKLKLEEGSLLDIAIQNETLVLSKCEPLKDFKNYIIDVCSCVENCIFFVISDSSIVFASKQYKEFEGEKINPIYYDQIKSNKSWENKADYVIANNLELKQKYAYCYPLETYGDYYGYACFFFNENANSEDKGMMCFVSKYIASKL